MSDHYNPVSDNAKENASFQGIQEGISFKQAQSKMYPGEDTLINATINDDRLYITTSDYQHTKRSI